MFRTRAAPQVVKELSLEPRLLDSFGVDFLKEISTGFAQAQQLSTNGFFVNRMQSDLCYCHG
jgi:hypothetical protein